MDTKNGVTVLAFAKANVALNITGKADGGLHALDGVMVSLDAFDTVKVTARRDGKISVVFTNAAIDCENNTAYKAAKIVSDALPEPERTGWDIHIEKGIPIGAGLGGSSADGAAVLRALDLMCKLSARKILNIRAAALSVGSDVPFMLTGGLARVRGAGDDMFFIENKLKLFAIGLMSESVSTAEAYKKFDELYPSGKYAPTDVETLCDKLLSADPAAVTLFGNALYEPAKALAPSVAHNAELLLNSGAVPCLTGSGGMVLGWFDDIERFYAAATALKDRPGFTVFTTARTGVTVKGN